jgi:solute carrier family 35 protein E3
MTESSTDRDRTASISSSTTEAESYDDTGKLGGKSSEEESYVNLKTPEELEIGDGVERAELLPQSELEKPQAPETTLRSSIIWMVVNTLATIGIVSQHKSPSALSTATNYTF